MHRFRLTPLAASFAFALGAGSLGCSSSTSSPIAGDGGPSADAGDSGGGDAGSCSATKPTCPKPCNTGFDDPTCTDGAWVCPPEPAIACADAGPRDAGADDGGNQGDAGLACGDKTCDPSATYCLTTNGLHHPDGGISSTYACEPIACDGGATGCACVANGCGCTDDAGAITVVCNTP